MKRFMVCLLFVVAATSSLAQQDFAAELSQLNAAIRGTQSSAEQRSFVPTLASLGERAFAADAFGVATSAFDYAYRIAQIQQESDEAADYKRRMTRAKTVAKEYAKVVVYRDKDDAASKRRVAEFQAFVKEDWQTALPVLAEGDDLIAKTAQSDLQRLGAEEIEAVADAWIKVARLKPAHARALYARAGWLYAAAAAAAPTPELMKKMFTLGSKIGYDTSPPAGSILVKGKYIYSSGNPCNANQTVEKAFDGKPDTCVQLYGGLHAWIAVDLRVPRVISRIVYAPHNNPDSQWQELACARTVGAVIQVSNRPDFEGALTIHTIIQVPVLKQLTTVTVLQPGVWRYVRYAERRTARPDDRLALGEFDVY